MADEDEIKKIESEENLRRQLRRRDFRTAMASAHETPTTDKRFESLLARLDEAEKKQR